ncbi:hypothetical protein LWC34_05890 [Kibdelosporangium philippinense]|uniref:DUF2007 domain-containing protein n=1 Tax=Kibdelosporangium philippinense TaxID=211113 RepID=A0ABS8Z5Q6_9PSEU|nr:hypothetical protein [Kibdelosporangium philippinense]MCE7002364.1 hypothetical protein [Kibdelosporangium philippinense]
MLFLATGRIVRPEETDAHMEEEVLVFNELKAEGVLQEVYFSQPGPGVVSVVDAPSPDAARAHLHRLRLSR